LKVLILCDLNDPDRNNDKLLEENMSLRECGITFGSVLTLHALGMDNEKALDKRKESLLSMKAAAVDHSIVHLDTAVGVAEADHSYNGVIFDVKSTDAHEIEVTSIHIGGMLGRVRVYARDRPWSADNSSAGMSQQYWAYRQLLSKDGWTLVADQVCRPSWDRLTEIKLDIPLCLLPHERKAIYCHSGLPDDLGIQYQSYERGRIFAKDEHISLIAGLGHTGSEPFETTNGWYRNWRGMAGRVSYRPKLKGWNPFENSIFPAPLKEAVRTMLLTHNRCSGLNRQMSLDSTSSDLIREEELMMEADENTGGGDGGGDIFPIMRSVSLQSTDSTASTSSIHGDPGTLSALPHGAVYKIMEYCHWDWFEDASKPAAEEATEPAQSRLGRPNRTRSPGEYSSISEFLLSHFGSTDFDGDALEDDVEIDDEDDEAVAGAANGLEGALAGIPDDYLQAIMGQMVWANSAMAPAYGDYDDSDDDDDDDDDDEYEGYEDNEGGDEDGDDSEDAGPTVVEMTADSHSASDNSDEEM
jgi:hypothetical protein